jgi:hypothetical protein
MAKSLPVIFWRATVGNTTLDRSTRHKLEPDADSNMFYAGEARRVIQKFSD